MWHFVQAGEVLGTAKNLGEKVSRKKPAKNQQAKPPEYINQKDLTHLCGDQAAIEDQ